MESKSEVDFLNLIHNQEFVCWVINPNQESDLYWKQIIREHPDREKELNNAVFIIKNLLKEEKKTRSGIGHFLVGAHSKRHNQQKEYGFIIQMDCCGIHLIGYGDWRINPLSIEFFRNFRN